MVPRCSVVVKFVVAFLGMWLGMLGMEERGDVRWNGCLEDNEQGTAKEHQSGAGHGINILT